jgi:hypothetical protein
MRLFHQLTSMHIRPENPKLARYMPMVIVTGVKDRKKIPAAYAELSQTLVTYGNAHQNGLEVAFSVGFLRVGSNEYKATIEIASAVADINGRKVKQLKHILPRRIAPELHVDPEEIGVTIARVRKEDFAHDGELGSLLKETDRVVSSIPSTTLVIFKTAPGVPGQETWATVGKIIEDTMLSYTRAGRCGLEIGPCFDQLQKSAEGIHKAMISIASVSAVKTPQEVVQVTTKLQEKVARILGVQSRQLKVVVGHSDIGNWYIDGIQGGLALRSKAQLPPTSSTS